MANNYDLYKGQGEGEIGAEPKRREIPKAGETLPPTPEELQAAWEGIKNTAQKGLETIKAGVESVRGVGGKAAELVGASAPEASKVETSTISAGFKNVSDTLNTGIKLATDKVNEGIKLGTEAITEIKKPKEAPKNNNSKKKEGGKKIKGPSDDYIATQRALDTQNEAKIKLANDGVDRDPDGTFWDGKTEKTSTGQTESTEVALNNAELLALGRNMIDTYKKGDLKGGKAMEDKIDHALSASSLTKRTLVSGEMGESEYDLDTTGVEGTHKDRMIKFKEGLVNSLSDDELKAVAAGIGGMDLYTLAKRDTEFKVIVLRKVGIDTTSIKPDDQPEPPSEPATHVEAAQAPREEGPTSSKAPATTPSNEKKGAEQAKDSTEFKEGLHRLLIQALEKGDKVAIKAIDDKLNEWRYKDLMFGSPKGQPYTEVGKVNGAPMRTQFKGEAIRERKQMFINELMGQGMTREQLVKLVELAPTPGILKKRSLKYAAQQRLDQMGEKAA